MDPTPVGEQTVGSQAVSGEPGRRAGLPQEAQGLWHELRGLAHDHLQLAALETQRAGESLVTMITAGMMVAGLLLSAWLGLVGAAVLALTNRGVMASDSALLLAVAVNLLVALVLCGVIRRRSHHLRFPANTRSLAAGGVGVPGCGDVLMAAERRGPSALTASLTVQIGEAEGRLRNRRRSVWVRGATLGRTLRQRMTDPAVLLWAGGLGFLIGELTRRQTPKSRDTDRSPDSGHAFFETVLNLIKLISWARTLFTALPGAGTQPSSPLNASVQTPDRSQENSQ